MGRGYRCGRLRPRCTQPPASRSEQGETLAGPAGRYHAAVKALRGIVAKRVDPFVEPCTEHDGCDKETEDVRDTSQRLRVPTVCAPRDGVGASRRAIAYAAPVPEPAHPQTPRFDLQSHSTRSDGVLEPAAAVARAAQAGVQLLALSDHDTVAGVDEALEAGGEHGVIVVPAIEISAIDDPAETRSAAQRARRLANCTSSAT